MKYTASIRFSCQKVQPEPEKACRFKCQFIKRIHKNGKSNIQAVGNHGTNNLVFHQIQGKKQKGMKRFQRYHPNVTSAACPDPDVDKLRVGREETNGNVNADWIR
jgi:hypothetical protein